MPYNLQKHFEGILLGTAVGDAIGLPREGLSRRRAQRLFGGPPLRHRFVFGRGMTSDDTEHTRMVAQALLASRGDPQRFARSFAWRLRWWFLGLPAGVGLATGKACLKLWLGFGPRRSGVWSAGNGPAMRSAILGVYAWNDPDALARLVTASTRVTHTDPAAEHGALAVALAAAYAVRCASLGRTVAAHDYLELVKEQLGGTSMLHLIDDLVGHVGRGTSFDEYLAMRGLSDGISGYVNHTVPVCLYSWLLSPSDFRAVVERVVTAGGDADSTGAIAGALAGVTSGADGIPAEWLDRLAEWPCGTAWLKRLAGAMSAAGQVSSQSRPVPLFWPAVILRNVFFLCLVLIHGLRRLLPPY